jgi:hypothetical protein
VVGNLEVDKMLSDQKAFQIFAQVKYNGLANIANSPGGLV